MGILISKETRTKLKAAFGQEKPRKYPWCKYTKCPWYCAMWELRNLQFENERLKAEIARYEKRTPE